MRELEGVEDEGSPTQQAAPNTWSLAAWQRLEVGCVVPAVYVVYWCAVLLMPMLSLSGASM